jgi:sulfur carrier protein ThiS
MTTKETLTRLVWAILFDRCSALIYNRVMQITYRDKTYDTKPNITARDAIRKVGLDPESVLVVVNGKLTTDDVVLREGDVVNLVAVVSGGM